MTLPTDALSPSTALPDVSAESRAADAWQRRFGVPWERVERAVRAVSDRAVAASRSKSSPTDTAPARSAGRPG